jgi:hypothetical protein
MKSKTTNTKNGFIGQYHDTSMLYPNNCIQITFYRLTRGIISHYHDSRADENGETIQSEKGPIVEVKC